MPTLRRYAEGLDTVVELGTRSIVSTWAFLVAKPKRLISVDIKHPFEYIEYDPAGCDLDLVYSEAGKLGVEFGFIKHDSVTVILPVCDLMFFDTIHTKHQLACELQAHGANVRKYMIFHDTETYRSECLPAILLYIRENSIWSVAEEYFNNNGLLILKRS